MVRRKEPMVTGVLRETKEGENRVALTPAGVHTLVLDGHTVLIKQCRKKQQPHRCLVTPTL